MADTFRTFVVVNPRSAGGGTGKRWQAISDSLSAALPSWDHAFTKAQGDATELTRNALRQGYEMIVAVGGDGTIHEVVNGFFDGEERVVEQPVLGLIPSGTGGDYRKTWQLSRDPAQACARLAGPNAKPVDAGRIRWTEPDGSAQLRYFANIASFGMSALVCVNVNASSKALGGKLTFLKASAAALLRYERAPVRLTTDGEDVREVSLTVGACCIGRYFGGGMMVAPDADPSDGRFDVVTLAMSKLDMVRFTSIYKGKHLDNPKVGWWQGAVVDAEPAGSADVFIEADGEVFGRLPARFEVIPNAFRIKV